MMRLYPPGPILYTNRTIAPGPSGASVLAWGVTFLVWGGVYLSWGA